MTKFKEWVKYLVIILVHLLIWTLIEIFNFLRFIWDHYLTLARTDLLYMLNWGTQWTMVSYSKK